MTLFDFFNVRFLGMIRATFFLMLFPKRYYCISWKYVKLRNDGFFFVKTFVHVYLFEKVCTQNSHTVCSCKRCILQNIYALSSKEWTHSVVSSSYFNSEARSFQYYRLLQLQNYRAILVVMIWYTKYRRFYWWKKYV